MIERYSRPQILAGKVVGRVWSFRDVTMHWQAEAAVRQSEEQYRLLADNAEDIVTVNDADGRCIYRSPSFFRITGWSLAEVAASDWRTRTHPDDVPRIEAAHTANLRGEANRVEHRQLCKDGSYLWLETYRRPDMDADGRVKKIILWSHNITERQSAEQRVAEINRQLTLALTDLRTAQQQLVEQERMRALGQMASGIAHDFNNALTPIVGFADLLLEHPEQVADTARVAHYLQLIKTSAQNATQVVRRLREFYRRRGTGDVFLPVELNPLIEQTVELTRPRWQQQTQAVGITIAVQTDLGQIPVINGNAGELRDALTNLLFNAVDSLPQGGTITIRTAVAEQYVRLEVADTGAGMSPEVQAHCFEPFFSTKGDHGTGLGLALVHGIIRRHDGLIAVESDPGIGTTFTIQFPLILSQPVVPPARSPADNVPPTPVRVLLVDDEFQLREMIETFLRIDDHRVELAGSGSEALTKFRPGKFDAVITDQAMPGMNGDQLAAAIKHQSPATPVILLTGFGAFMEVEGNLPAGVDLVLAKPISIADLRNALRHVLHRPPPPSATS